MPAKPTFLILANKKPPSIYRFQRYQFGWFRKLDSRLQAIEIAYGLSLIGIHGVLKTVHPNGSTSPLLPREPLYQTKKRAQKALRKALSANT